VNKALLNGFILFAGLAVVFSLPHLLPIVHINLLIEIAFFGLFAVSCNMLFGYGGLLSMGHAAYFGIGAYTMALLLKHVAGLPLLLAVLIGGIGGGLGGLIVGYFCVRLKGGYFALLTLAFCQFFFAIALKWRSLTGGEDGIGVKKPTFDIPLLGSMNMRQTIDAYYFVIVIVMVCLFIIWYLTKTPFGNTIKAIKENDERAGFIGYNVFLSRLTLYTIAGFFAGIAGSLFAIFEGFVSTGTIDISRSIEVLFMIIIGGTGSFFGPILGSGVYVYFTDRVSRMTERWEFVLGVLFILIVLYAHKGLIGLFPWEKIKSIVFTRR
jgi:branched-chain amino acid transport system permease protein